MTSEMKLLSELLTVPKAAKEIGKSKMTLYRWIYQGKIETNPLGGILFITRAEVERLKAEVGDGG